MGAVYVRDSQERRFVLTRLLETSTDRVRQIMAVHDVLAKRGYPLARYRKCAELGTSVVVLQECLPGGILQYPNLDIVTRMLALIDAQRGTAAGLPTLTGTALHLDEPGTTFCRHDTLRAHSRRSARLLSWIREVGKDTAPTTIGDDIVHFDFHAGNILVADGSISGVVDWGGVCRGSRFFDLVTFRFGVSRSSGIPGVAQVGSEVIDHLDAMMTQVMVEDEFRRHWAHMSLRMADWSIRHFTPAVTEEWLTLAESHMH
ncbi:phosphotransferase [Catenulispora sp. GAS73]|uniref:phosphotransferase n=1 Tax=Catenulispora sp. GAS73 TaxID=3156269 RepID=UPI0035126E20